jgi:hypothetical protein
MIARFISPYLLPILAGLALLGWLLAVTFKVQIEGFKLWPIHVVGWREENKTLRLDLDTIKNGQALAKAKADQARRETEAKYRDIAERNERAHKIELEKARAATDRFIISNRLRIKAAGGPSSGAAAPAEGDGAGLPRHPADTAELVAVPESDVRNHAKCYVYAKKAYDWAQELKAKGLAD